MNEMMSYIFGTLQKNETTVNQVVKVVNKHTKLMNQFSLFVVIGGVYVCVSEYRRKEQEKKIKQLREELDGLTGKKTEEEVEASEQ